MNKAGMLTEECIIQQSSIYVHPIQCLLHKKRRYLTENDKLKNRCTLVTNVGSVIHLRAACIGIRIFMQISSSAQNVANVVKAAVHWQDTGDFMQMRNHLNVLSVADDLQG